MTQVVFGAALGCIIGQAALYSLQQCVGWLQRGEVHTRIRKLTALRGPTLIAGFIKYAGVIGVCAALMTLGAWAVGDYLAARSARSVAKAGVSETTTAPSISNSHGHPNESAELVPAPKADSSAADPVDDVDPYTDSEFKVHRRPRRAGVPLNLTETLVQRSETRARADLLRQTQQNVHRSQYDCETAERVSKYLKADLDVWAFAMWQLKYFPADSYEGATLPQCRDIKSVIDSSAALAANRHG